MRRPSDAETTSQQFDRRRSWLAESFGTVAKVRKRPRSFRCRYPDYGEATGDKELDRNFSISLPRWIDCGRSRRALCLRKPNSRDLRIEDRRVEETLRLHRSGTLPLLQSPQRS